MPKDGIQTKELDPSVLIDNGDSISEETNERPPVGEEILKRKIFDPESHEKKKIVSMGSLKPVEAHPHSRTEGRFTAGLPKGEVVKPENLEEKSENIRQSADNWKNP